MILSFFIISINIHAAPKDWTLTSNIDGTKTWQLISNTDVTGSLANRKTASPIDWNTTNGEDFFKAFEEKKKKMLSIIGIVDWKVTKHSWIKFKNYNQLEITGSYTDSKKQDISFTEQHLYYPDRTLQMLHTHPKELKNAEKYSKDILDIMRSTAVVKNE